MSKITFFKNIPLYNSYENPIYFENTSKRKQFFDYYEYDQDYSSYTKEINFKPSNLLNTTIDLAIYDYYGEVSGLDAYNYNYAIYNDDSTQSLYYYFITNINYKSNNVYSFDMELDVMTTYIPNCVFTFNGKLPIERKMCNRIVPYDENGTTKYRLDFKYAKVLEGNNNPQVAKLYEPEYRLSTTLNNTDADDKFKKATWTYFFYTMKNPTQQEIESLYNLKYTNDNGDIIDSGLYCVCLPNFRWACNIDNTYYLGANVNNFYSIFKDGTETRNIVNIVNSPYPFWNYLRTDLKYVDARTEGSSKTKKAIYIPPTDDMAITDVGDNVKYKVMFIKNITSNDILFDYVIDNPKYQTIYPSEFRQEGIPKILKYEPKLYNSDNSYLKIIDREGNSYKYDYTLLDANSYKVNGYKLQLKSKNCVNVEGTSTFYYIDTNEGNYDEKVEKTSYDYPIETFSGLTSMTVDGQNVFSDAFTDYVQQHKNYLLSGLLSNTKLDVGASANMYKLFKPSINAGVNASGLLQTKLQIDDVANAPLEVTSTKGNFVNKFMMNYRLLPYIVSYELTEIQKKNIYDIYFKFGYLVNSDFTFNECMQRLGFNYIKTGESIKQLIEPVEDVPIPNNVIDKIDSIFRKGTRLWKLNSQNKVYNNFNFDYENWEDIQ